jgi:hypothetical protein
VNGPKLFNSLTDLRRPLVCGLPRHPDGRTVGLEVSMIRTSLSPSIFVLAATTLSLLSSIVAHTEQPSARKENKRMDITITSSRVSAWWDYPCQIHL